MSRAVMGIRLPFRLAARCWCPALSRRQRRIQRRSRAYRVKGAHLQVCRGRSLVQERRLSDAELATVLVWAAMGVWT